MDPEPLQPNDENLFYLAAELGLLSFEPGDETKKNIKTLILASDSSATKPYSQLT